MLLQKMRRIGTRWRAFSFIATITVALSSPLLAVAPAQAEELQIQGFDLTISPEPQAGAEHQAEVEHQLKFEIVNLPHKKKLTASINYPTPITHQLLNQTIITFTPYLISDVYEKTRRVETSLDERINNEVQFAIYFVNDEGLYLGRLKSDLIPKPQGFEPELPQEVDAQWSAL